MRDGEDPAEQGDGELSDARLVDEALQGGQWAMEALFRRHAQRANRLAYRLLANDADVDDLVQDAFIQAFTKLETLKNPQAFRGWLSSIVVRTAHKRLRKRRLLNRLGLRRTKAVDFDTVISSHASPEVRAELKKLLTAVSKMPADVRVALILQKVEGMTIAEIAQQMDVSASTVKRRLRTAAKLVERHAKPVESTS